MATYALQFIDGPLAGETVPLHEGSTVLGRSRQCDICLADKRASSRHLRITVSDNEVEAEDLGSKNGSYSDGSPLTVENPLALVPGAELKVGNSRFMLALSNDYSGGEGTLQTESRDGSLPPAASAFETQDAKQDKRTYSGTLSDNESDENDGNSKNEKTLPPIDQSPPAKSLDTAFEEPEPSSLTPYTNVGDIEKFLAEAGPMTQEEPPPQSDVSPRKRLTFPLVIAVALLAVVGILIVGGSRKSSTANDPESRGPNLLEADFFTIPRPVGWEGKVLNSRTVQMSSKDTTLHCVFTCALADDLKISPLWTDAEEIQKKLQEYSIFPDGMKKFLELPDLHIESPKETELGGNIKAIEFDIRGNEARDGYAVYAISRNALFLYVSSYPSQAEMNKPPNALRTILNYLSLEGVYSTPYFQRPILKRAPLDREMNLREGIEKLESGKYILGKMPRNEDSRSAIQLYQRGLKSIASSTLTPSEDIDQLLRPYDQCLKQRKQMLSRWQGRIMQLMSMGKRKNALEDAEKLYSEATLSHEMEIREWAWRRIAELKNLNSSSVSKDMF